MTSLNYNAYKMTAIQYISKQCQSLLDIFACVLAMDSVCIFDIQLYYMTNIYLIKQNIMNVYKQVKKSEKF